MTSVSLLTPIKYARSNNFTEGTLSTLSQYFYLGGVRATVIKGYEVHLEQGKISCLEMALKVASYILLFPLTITLLAINLALHARYHFTIITPSTNRKFSTEPEKESTVSSFPSTKIEPQNIPSYSVKPDLSPNVDIHKKESTNVLPRAVTTTVQTPIMPSLFSLDSFSITPENKPKTPNGTAQTVEYARQKILTPAPARVEPIFSLTQIKIADQSIPDITSLDAMHQKVQELGQEVAEKHISLRLDIPKVWSEERKQGEQFIHELRTVADVITTRWDDIFYIIPKKVEGVQNYSILRRYENGVIEQVDSASNTSAWEDWKGRRIYPNGKVESGEFERFYLVKGTWVEGEMTSYRLPNKLVVNYNQDRYLTYTDTTPKRLIVIQKKPNADSRDYVEIDEPLIPTLTDMLKEDSYVQKQVLEEILSGPINGQEFVQSLLESNSIFSLKQNSLKILLKIIQEKGWAIDLRHKNPENNKTLFESYLDQKEIVETSLAIDPTLIQLTEGIESSFVSALLMNAKPAASLILTTLQNRGTALLPREDIFRKIAFKEEVSLEELQNLPKEDQEIAYRLANIYSRLNVLRILRTLGLNRTEDLRISKGPSIFSCNMDALEMYECLQDFLKNLHTQGTLCKKSEFNVHQLVDHYTKKVPDLEDFGRFLGQAYIQKKVNELGLNHIKLPKSFIVLEDDATIKLQINSSLKLRLVSYEDNTNIYTEQIQENDRKITTDEMSELLHLFEATGYGYFDLDNIAMTEDKIYIVNTASFNGFWNPNSFKNGKRYTRMKEFVSENLPFEQRQIFIDELNSKIATSHEQEQELIAQRAVEKEALKKTGCIFDPSFTFTAQELCS